MIKNISWLNEINIAHRGLHDISKGIPENSIIAFDNAIRNNVAIELDVHVIKDGNIIVFHDDNLIRCCNLNKKIKDCTLEDIKKVKLFNTDYKIPLLEDTLSYIDGKVPLIIEIKTDMPYYIVCPKIVKLLKTYKGTFAIKSFDPLIVYWFKKYYNYITRGMLISNFNKEKKFKIIKKLLISSMIFVPLCKPDYLSVQLQMLKSKKIKQIKKKKNLPVLGWTFKTKIDRINYESYCDSWIFENHF